MQVMPVPFDKAMKLFKKDIEMASVIVKSANSGNIIFKRYGKFTTPVISFDGDVQSQFPDKRLEIVENSGKYGW